MIEEEQVVGNVRMFEDGFEPSIEEQRIKVLHFFQDHVGEFLTMDEIVKATTYKAPARVSELQKLGQPIESFKVKGERYRLYRLNFVKEEVQHDVC